MKKQLVIMGGRGNGTVLAATVEDIIADGGDWEILGILDDNVPRGDPVDGYEVLGPLTDSRELVKRGCHFYFAIQAPGKFIPRFSILKALDLPPDRFPSFVHPSAAVSKNVSIGRGVAVTPLCYIGQNAVIGDHVYLHPHAVVSRDTELAIYSYMAANSTLGAGSVLEMGAYLGLGATVREYRRVGEWAMVAMGAAVVADVPSHTVVAGVPAREFGSIEDRWEHA